MTASSSLDRACKLLSFCVKVKTGSVCRPVSSGHHHKNELSGQPCETVKSLHRAGNFGIPPATNRMSCNSELEWSSELTSANPPRSHDREESCSFRCINCTGLETGIIVMWATNHDECLSNPPNCFEKRLLADER